MGAIVATRTPLRVSFFGGGTDLPDYYRRGYGAVVSTTIDKYVYVTIKPHGELFDEIFRLNYSKTEQATSVDEIENEIARKSIRFVRCGGHFTSLQLPTFHPARASDPRQASPSAYFTPFTR